MLALKKVSPDVVFININLPGTNGFELIAYLRRYPSMTGVPVVVITDDSDKDIYTRVVTTGALMMIVKPVRLDEIESALVKAGLREISK